MVYDHDQDENQSLFAAACSEDAPRPAAHCSDIRHWREIRASISKSEISVALEKPRQEENRVETRAASKANRSSPPALAPGKDH
ncbi:hypothetical protein [Rhizobium subbaraonis]|uniref:hypothetical protein n=1 Tax=Rhizobium subbaraonis TaxID=908946 RepID=UPI000BE391EA|nr:hypothetical protein [Rhizobium subbaraonis]MCW5711727.1 hypothetical protein [Shinella sp.]